MRYRVWFLVLITMLLAPEMAVAQSTPSTSTSETSLGRWLVTIEILDSGWRQATSGTFQRIEASGLISHQAVFFGPNGARMQIVVFATSDRIGDLSKQWDTLSELWGRIGGWYKLRRADGAINPVLPTERAQTAPPIGVNDALRWQGRDLMWGQPVGVGLYLLENGPVILVLIEGAYEGLTGIDAVDTLASMSYDRGTAVRAAA